MTAHDFGASMLLLAASSEPLSIFLMAIGLDRFGGLVIAIVACCSRPTQVDGCSLSTRTKASMPSEERISHQ